MTPYQNTVKATYTDPAYLATRARFWRITAQTAECEHCGATFDMPTRTTATRQIYCSPRCRSGAGSRLYNERRRKESAA